jgi:YVTN family beta-propeller protein
MRHGAARGLTPVLVVAGTLASTLVTLMPAIAHAASVTPAAAAVHTIPVGSNPDALAVDASTDTIYVANYSDGTVSVIDGTTQTVTQTITVGSDPTAIGVDETTDTIYVANDSDGTVSVIDGVTGKVSDTIPIGNVPGSPYPGTDALDR